MHNQCDIAQTSAIEYRAIVKCIVWKLLYTRSFLLQTHCQCVEFSPWACCDV